MGYCQAHYATLGDLSGYFKKADLLAGLTEVEQSIARENLGITESGERIDLTSVTEIKYADLNAAIKANKLIPNKKYILTDYQTIYSSNVRNSAGQLVTWGYQTSAHPSVTYRLILTALTNNKVDSRVVIDDDARKNWVVFYNVAEEVLADGYKTKGRITYLRDNNNNSAYYDFKSIRFRRTSSELATLNIATSYLDVFTFTGIDNGNVEDSSNYAMTKNNKVKHGSYNNVIIGSPYNNVIEEDCENNTMIKSMHDCKLGMGSSNNIFNEAVNYTTGSISNKVIAKGDTCLATTIDKQIYKVNEKTVLAFFDPITYSQQIIEL